jgi:hypothetical protein
MGKFAKYLGKVKFKIDGEDFDLDFKVRDRIALAAVYDNKDQKGKYTAMFDFCLSLLKQNYPEESPEELDAFLAKNMDRFVSELMISAGLMKRSELEEFANTKKAELQ